MSETKVIIIIVLLFIIAVLPFPMKEAIRFGIMNTDD